jgi:hypothetical protein
MDHIHYFSDGTALDFSQERLAPFNIEAMLYTLGQEHRFANQIPWTVLQHSLAVGKSCEILFPGNDLLIQHGYLHDFSEVVVRDVPSPLKKEIGKAWYQVENEIKRKIFEYYHLSPKLGDDDEKYLDMVDKTMAFVEAVNFCSPDTISLMKRQSELVPEYIVICTSSFVHTQGVEIYNQEDMLNPLIIKLYKEIILSAIL